MDPRCIAAVTAAAGKALSKSKLQAIEDAISAKMRDLARQDRTRWQGLSRDQRVTEAAVAAVQDVKAQAALKEYRQTLQVLRTAETDSRISSIQGSAKLTRSQALIRDIEQTGQYIDAVRNDAISGLGDLMDAAANRDGTGLLRNLGMRIFDLDNPVTTRDVVREVFRNADGSTGNRIALAGAKAWLETIEPLRLRFNAAGGDVGKLGYGYLSQIHDAVRVMEAGPQAWAAKVLPLLDREQYVRPDGSLMDNAELTAMLEAAQDTIATGGLNKTSPGDFKGSGARANRGSDSRVLHFKDGDAWMAYMDEYGQGSLYDAMLGHVGHMARDIGLVERYGPNPEQQFRLQNDIAERADGAGTVANRSAFNTPEAYWNLVSGKATTPQNRFAAQIGQDARNLQTAAKLGGAVISSITDMGTIATTLHYNRLPYFDMLRNIGAQFDSNTRQFLQSHGIIGESLTSTLNRWTGDNLTHSLSGRVAGSVMKLSLMNAWTDGLRGAFAMTQMNGLARMARKSWGSLDEWDRYLLTRKGITEQDWAIVNRAQASNLNGYDVLTPESVRGVGDADLEAASPQSFQRIRDRIAEQTADLTARNQQETEWIKGRIDKFDDARNALNRQIKERLTKRLDKNEQASEPLLQRMALLDAQREQAKLQADLEAEYNTLFTRADIKAFEEGLRDASSASTRAEKSAISAAERSGRVLGRRQHAIDQRLREARRKFDQGGDGERLLIRQEIEAANLERAQLQNDIEIALKATPDAERQALRNAIKEVSEVRKSADAGARTARRVGERYGEAKGRLQQRMREIESRIAEMDRDAHRQANTEGKAAQKKADAMAADLKDFIVRSQDRQQRRAHVIQRIQDSEGAAVLAEAQALRNQVATKILAYTMDEAQFAVVNPDMATRAIVTGGGMPTGTIRGEAMRSFAQFKSFPVAMLTRHWRRVLETPQGLQGAPAGFGAESAAGGAINKVAVLAGLNLTLMMLGSMVLQTKALVQGKDPYDMTEGKFWLRAVAQGGGAGYLGDLLFKDPTEQRGNKAEQVVGTVLGPSAGAVAGLAGDLVVANAWEAAKGKDTHFGAEAVRWGNSQLPYSNLWWTRGAYEHWFLFAAQEALNPGYLARMRQRAQKDWNQGYFWDPAEALPSRAPDFGNIVGE